MDRCLAVDIGGTKIALGLVDRAGALTAAQQVPTPAGSEAEELFDALAAAVSGVLGEAGRDLRSAVVACGVGCGGPMEAATGQVSPLNIPGWRSFPLRARMEALTGLPTVVDNDAKAYALGEGWVGAAKGRSNYVAMVVSTGVGGGIVLDGRVVQGRTGNAGHIGHVIVEPEGHLCGCGARGCLEAEASGSAIARLTGKPPTEAPAEVVHRTGMLVGRALSSVCNLLDVDYAVVGGSVAQGFGTPFVDAANEELRSRSQLAFSSDARVVAGTAGFAANVIGAGALGFSGASKR